MLGLSAWIEVQNTILSVRKKNLLILKIKIG